MSQHALWHTIGVDTLMNLDAQLFAITLSAACTHTDILLKLLETITISLCLCKDTDALIRLQMCSMCRTFLNVDDAQLAGTHCI